MGSWLEMLIGNYHTLNGGRLEIKLQDSEDHPLNHKTTGHRGLPIPSRDSTRYHKASSYQVHWPTGTYGIGICP